MNCFLDSSCFLRRITLDGPNALDWDEWEHMSASERVRVEVARALNRLRLAGVYADEQHADSATRFEEMAAGIEWLPISASVLALAAEPTPFHIKSLDAIHLATARLLHDAPTADLVFATHDRQLGLAAVALGFDVVGI